MTQNNSVENVTHLVKDADWWRGAVIYQIYPRSFQDSNNDGIGDLPGIVERLPYVASLGVDAIWISPFFTSPMRDFGYDVSNYRDVDPIFGELGDFDNVVETAHRLGLKVMIDLVLSHTSDEHPWFKESREDKDNSKADWFVWADPKPDGNPPNNWLSIFGGSAWQWDSRRCQYYLHNFLSSQPDLNFHTPAVQDALLDVVQFWLDRGVDGFRLDTINFYVHDAMLPDNPPLPSDQRNATIAPQVNPYNHQEHLFDKNQPENLDFLRKFRALLNPTNAAVVGEVGDAQRGLEIMGEYTSGDDLVQMCYAFEFLANDRPTAADFKSVMDRVDEVAADGWPCWAFSNHDVERHASRWAMSGDALKAMATLMMCLRGSACLYQGEELGLPQADVPFEALQDPYGIEFWPKFKGRDGCRTPMPWEQDNRNGGFSGATKTWLPMSAEHLNMSVAAAETEMESTLRHYREAIAFRKSYAALVQGDQIDMQVSSGVLTFIRRSDDADIFCAFNLTDGPAQCVLPQGSWTAIGETVNSATLTNSGKIDLLAWQPCLARKDR